MATELTDEVDFYTDGWGDELILHQLGAHLDVFGQLEFVPLTSFRPAVYSEFKAAVPQDAVNIVLRVMNVWGAWVDLTLPGGFATKQLQSGIVEEVTAWNNGTAAIFQYLTTALLTVTTAEPGSDVVYSEMLHRAQFQTLQGLVRNGYGAQKDKGYHVTQVQTLVLCRCAILPCFCFHRMKQQASMLQASC
jgi:hypothetical protein